ncbi:MAG: peptidylprolyl isomerase [Chloroflexi bacterium]|nr:peptidylprolyl isomerase [Chloroflexota bacterium]
MIGGLFAAVFLRSQNPSRTSPDVPSATASPTVDPNATPTPTATPDPKKFTEAAQVTDPSKSYQATIKTDKGDIVLKLYVDKAPLTVNAFVFLAQKGFYDGIVFHRVEPGFVVQGGDPTGTGSGGPGFETDIDQNDLKNKRGFVAMARAGASTKFGSQFFIDLKDNVALDSPSASVPKPYYPFAEVVSGMDVVDKLVKGDVMRSVTIQETAVAPAQ